MDIEILVVLLAVLITLGLTLWLAIWSGRRAQSDDDWTTGGRRLPVYVVIGTQFATMMGGATIVGQVGVGYANGWSTVMYGFLTAIGLFPLLLLVKWLRERNLSSLPDVLTRLYGKSRLMDIVTISLVIIIPFGWLCSNLVAFGNIFSRVIGVSPDYLIPIFGLICLGFVIPAGLTSVAWADFAFGVGMLIFGVTIVLFGLNLAGGWDAVQSSVPQANSSFPEGLWSVGALTVVFWILAVMPGNLTNQQLYQRVFAARSTRGAKAGVASAAVLYLLATVWAALLGMSVRSLNPSLDNPELATGWLLSQVPLWLLAIFSAFIVGTIMSTASSAIQSCVVNITHDIYAGHMAEDPSGQRLLRLSRLVSVIIIVLAVLLALFYTQALNWIINTFAYSVSALIVPIFVGYALRNSRVLNREGAIGAMLSGLVGSAIAQISGTTIPYVAFGMAASLIGIFVFSAVYRERGNRDSATVEMSPEC